MPNVLLSLILASPKSTSFASPSSSMTLSGLRSRWAYLQNCYSCFEQEGQACTYGSDVFESGRLECMKSSALHKPVMMRSFCWSVRDASAWGRRLRG